MKGEQSDVGRREDGSDHGGTEPEGRDDEGSRPWVDQWARGPDVDTPESSIVEQFERRVEEHSDRTALEYEGGLWTYRELNRRANRLAQTLREHGVGPNVAVGVSLERSPELIASLLGVWKAGGGYVALEPRLPDGRLRYMAEDAGIEHVLASGTESADWTTAALIEIEAALKEGPESSPSVEVGPEDLAYILYTSGTTGAPKGVMMQRGAVREHIRAMNRKFPIREGDVVLQKTPFGFDVSVPEIFQTLTSGRTLALASEGAERDPAILIEDLERFGVTDVRIVPTLLTELIDREEFGEIETLRRVLSAGEALIPELRDEFIERSDAELWNLWGPTEATVYGTFWKCHRDPSDDRVPIGRPLDGNDLYVLDETQQAQPPGDVGELCVGGNELAVGYRDKPAQTAEAFVPNPMVEQPGARMYRSGDLVYWDGDGILQFLGRRDRQIQLRGIRVELGELESHLAELSEVRQSAVRTVDESQGRAQTLVAYLVPEGDELGLSPTEIRNHLAERLQRAVVPGQYVAVEEIPRTPSGKLDRSSLPAPDEALRDREPMAPQTATERRVAAIWREFLSVDEVGVRENFFGVGGHSLVAVRILARLQEEWGVQISLERFLREPTVEALAALVERSRASEDTSLSVGEYGREAPLTAQQRRLWYLQKVQPESTAYNELVAFRVEGDLDESAFGGAVDTLVDRHESLRTLFVEGDDGPMQRIVEAPESQLEMVDQRQASDPARTTRKHIQNVLAEPFDLAEQLPVRPKLYRLGDEEWVVAFVFHHIAIDEWAIRILLHELEQLYVAENVEEDRSRLDEPPQVAEYALFRQKRDREVDSGKGLEFWRDHLRGADPRVDWPIEDDSAAETHSAGYVEFEFDSTTSERLRAFARDRESSLFPILYAAFVGFLGRYTGQFDLTVGVPVNLRDHPRFQQVVGFLLNTLPLRARLDPDESFEEWAARRLSNWREALRFQDVPLQEIVDAVELERSADRGSLFDVMFTYVPGDNSDETYLYVPGDSRAGAWGSLSADAFDYGGLAEAKCALNVAAWKRDDRIVGTFEYDAGRFEAADIERMAGAFERFVGEALEAPGRSIGAYALLDAESERCVEDWGWGPRVEVPDEPVHRLFEERVEVHPERVALSFGGGEWSYRELNRRANQLARMLLDCGVVRGSRVGVHVERSPQMIQSVLGIMKAGGTYVPLEPSTPAKRNKYIARDSGAEVVVVGPGGRSDWEGRFVLELEANDPPSSEGVGGPERGVDPEQIVYVLYTSGTTGRPKGVMVPHRAVVNHCEWRRQEFELSPQDKFLLKSPLDFDASVLEIYPILHAGGTLVCTQPDGERNPGHMAEVIVEHEVSRIWTVPVQLEGLMKEPEFQDFEQLSHAFCGGEAWSASLRERFFEVHPDTELYNGYGPTEACIFTTTWECRSDPDYQVNPIGKPVGNYQVYVVDEMQRPVPAGAEGELLVAGPGLAHGYNGKPRKTATSFVPDSNATIPGRRVYRTGDIVRWDRNGNLEYKARRDDQVQLQGVRTELPEVESVLEQVEAVEMAAVKVVDVAGDGANALAAYLVGDEPSVEEVREHAREELQEAKVPKFWTILQSLPLSPTGKIERSDLPEPGRRSDVSGLTAPQTETEETIARIWREHLELDELGVYENFFEIGGHSLLAVRVQGDLEEAFGVEVPLEELLERPTVAGVAEYLETSERIESTTVERHDYGTEAPVSGDQRFFWMLDRLDLGADAFHVPLAFRLRGSLDAGALRSAFERLVSRHEILRTVYPERAEGPVQSVREAGEEIDFEVESVEQEVDPERAVRRRVSESVSKPFDLETHPPFRIRLFRLGDDDHILFTHFYHIVIDEWTVRLMLREVGEAYQAEVQGRTADLPELPIQFADFAIWERERLEGPDREESMQYWREHLAGASSSIRWPTVVSNPSTNRRAGEESLELGEHLSAELREYAESRELTIFLLFYAVYTAFLAKYTGQRDLVVGVPATKRRQSELQDVIGYLINTLPIRAEIPWGASLDEWTRRVRNRWIDSVPHQWIPMETILRELKSDSEGEGEFGSLFDTMISYLPDWRLESFGELQLEEFDHGVLPAPKVDFNLIVNEREGGFAMRAVYDPDVFDGRHVESFLEEFQSFVEANLERSDEPLFSQVARPGGGVREPQDDWSQGPRTSPRDETLHEGFERQVESSPTRRAVQFEGNSWTYEELDRWASAIARELNERSIGVGDRVGVALQRSAKLVAALLGILKSGAAYVPLEETLPEKRRNYIVETSRLDAILCEEGQREPFASWDLEILEGLPMPVDEGENRRFRPVPPESPAYLIHTSGSTGWPKGVVVPHRAVTNHVQSKIDLMEYSRDDTFLFRSSLGFDASVTEIFVPLSLGAELVVVGADEHRNPEYLVEVVREAEVNVVETVPSMLKMVVDQDGFGELRPLEKIVLGGEALEKQLRDRVLAESSARLHNPYGPTETTVEATMHECREGDHDVRIGRPMHNYSTYVCDELLGLRGIGERGELWIGGDGLAHGYAGRAAKTALSFVPDPFGDRPGRRIYRSGDLVSWAGDGRLRYHSRRDHQVQVRGVRVELPAIEAHLERMSGLREAAVRPVEANAASTEMLLAYVVVRNGESVDLEDVREQLRQRVDEKRMPARVLEIDEMPRTASGTIDRGSLPEPDAERIRSERSRVTPRNDIERRVAEIWKKHLGLEEIGVHEDFFELGGHSLMAVRMQSDFEEAFDLSLPIREFFDRSTCAGIAESIVVREAKLADERRVRKLLDELAG